MIVGKLINKAGKGRYQNQDALEKTIAYITRTRENENRQGELVCWGTLGAGKFKGVDGVIDDFKAVQSTYKRAGRFGRYADHEIYSFSEEGARVLTARNELIKETAKKMARTFYRDGYQVVYAAHEKDEGDENLHIHFIVNTVSFVDSGKRKEYFGKTKEREETFHRIEQKAIRKALRR